MKIIPYHGWNDQTLQPAYSPDYYDHALRKLRLSGMAAVLETRPRQAQTDNLAPIEWGTSEQRSDT